MKKELFVVFVVVGFLVTGTAKSSLATLITSTFTDYPGFTYSNTGTRFEINKDVQEWYKNYYGIIIERSYMYTDPGDIFDGMGVSNGTFFDTFKYDVSGVIKFVKTTNFVSVDAVSLGEDVVFSAFDRKDRLVESYIAPKFGDYSFTLSGRNISYLTFTSIGGYVSLSNLSYNYKGSLPTVPIIAAPVPEPTTIFLFAIGLAGLAAVSRKR